jgi:hypothetical protein
VPFGQRPDHVAHVGADLADGDRLQRHVHPARLDAGQVEHLVNEPQQVPAALEDLLHLLPLARRRGAHLQQLAEAEDGVERGAQLVAHAGEEVALGAVGGLGRDLGLLQVGDGAVAVEDVAELDADLEHGLHERLVGLAGLAGEELQHGHDAADGEDGKAAGAPDAEVRGRPPAREVGVARDVLDPDGGLADEHAARQARARGEAGRLRHLA